MPIPWEHTCLKLGPQCINTSYCMWYGMMKHQIYFLTNWTQCFIFDERFHYHGIDPFYLFLVQRMCLCFALPSVCSSILRALPKQAYMIGCRFLLGLYWSAVAFFAGSLLQKHLWANQWNEIRYLIIQRNFSSVLITQTAVQLLTLHLYPYSYLPALIWYQFETHVIYSEYFHLRVPNQRLIRHRFSLSYKWDLTSQIRRTLPDSAHITSSSFAFSSSTFSLPWSHVSFAFRFLFAPTDHHERWQMSESTYNTCHQHTCILKHGILKWSYRRSLEFCNDHKRIYNGSYGNYPSCLCYELPKEPGSVNHGHANSANRAPLLPLAIPFCAQETLRCRPWLRNITLQLYPNHSSW